MALRRLAALGLVLGTVTSAPAIDVTECGQTIGRSEVGQLQQDLDCHATGLDPARGIFLQRGATLELNGHTITGDGSGFGIQVGGRRRDLVAIDGPGVITNFFVGITGVSTRLRVRHVVAHHNRYGFEFKVSKRIEMTSVAMNDNEFGITGRGVGFVGQDIEARRNSSVGVSIAGPASLTRLVATGNGEGGGLSAAPPGGNPRRFRIIDSTITGNNGLGAGYDVLATSGVKLVNSTCDRGARVRFDEISDTTTVIGALGCAADPQ